MIFLISGIFVIEGTVDEVLLIMADHSIAKNYPHLQHSGDLSTQHTSPSICSQMDTLNIMPGSLIYIGKKQRQHAYHYLQISFTCSQFPWDPSCPSPLRIGMMSQNVPVFLRSSWWLSIAKPSEMPLLYPTFVYCLRANI